MALTGEQTFRGLTISNAYVRVMTCDHRVVDRSTEDNDGIGTSEKPDSDEGPVAYRAAPDTVAKSEPAADARPRQDET